AAMGVVHGNGALDKIRGAGSGAPVPAVAADLAAVIEVIEGDKLARDGVMVGRERFRKQVQPGIAIAFFQIAQDLVIGAVLFDDVNDVANPGTQEGEQSVALRGFCRYGKVVVARHLQREGLQGFLARPRNGGEAALFQLPYILLSQSAGTVTGE